MYQYLGDPLSVLKAAMLELAGALDAAADALVQTAEGQSDVAIRMEMLGRAAGYSEAASDIRNELRYSEDEHK